MSRQNRQKLFAKFAYFYNGTRTLPHRIWGGFECGDGWFDLIFNLSKALQDEAINRHAQGGAENWPEVTQVKQKDGALHFCLAQPSEATDALISEARLASQKICEICGAQAAPVVDTQGCRKTLCTEHAAAFLCRSPPAADPEKSPSENC